MTTEAIATEERENQNEEQSSEELQTSVQPNTSALHPERESSNGMIIHLFLFDLYFKNGHTENV